MTSNTSTREIKLSLPVQFIKGVGPLRAALMEKLGVRTAADLLFLFPRRYEDFTGQSSIHDLQLDQVASVIGVVDDIDETKKDGGHVLYVLLKQGNCFLRGIWFNQEFMLNKFRFGQTVQFRGKVTERGGRLQMTHPSVTWIDDLQAVPQNQLLPVYPLTEGIKQGQMREIVAGTLETFAPLVTEAFPDELRQATGLCDIQQAMAQIHAPANADQLQSARRRLVFQELLILQLALSMRRQAIRSRAVAPPLPLTAKIRARIFGRLPFQLRDAQRTAFEEIATDMAERCPMNRLLHGEVGSGKTIVAACAMLLAVAHSHQAVLMAPTEILVHQHFNTLRKLLAGSRVRIALCTGGQSQKERTDIAEQIEQGQIDLVIGTTAVVNSRMKFNQLGLVVIDEQHKFGVRQRALLKQAGFDPHYLVMTATPIPRTISMTLFGDLDVSTLHGDPAQSEKVKTYIGNIDNRQQWWQFVERKLQEGRQGFVIAPFVEAADDSAINSAEQLFESLANGPFEAYRLAVLHGRQSTAEKQQIMAAFVAGDVQLLVATGVVEVGIDVPNATVMTIESAERFGLSQLHQLRGRVGRGRHQGYVCAFPSDGQSAEIDRLQAFSDVADGFELAQLDLKFRGPGNLLSTRQTGFPPLRIADLIQDEDVLVETQSVARQIIGNDPELTHPQYQRLRHLVISRYGKALDLGDVG